MTVQLCVNSSLLPAFFLPIAVTVVANKMLQTAYTQAQNKYITPLVQEYNNYVFALFFSFSDCVV